MLRLQWAVIALTGLFTYYTEAQTARTVQDDWLVPALPDFSTIITLGQSYELQWTGDLQNWFAQYAPSANVTNVALWMTPSSASSGSNGEFLISSSVNVNTTYSYPWVVSLTIAQLTITADWTFRFLPADQAYTTNPNQQQISSPRVIVHNAASSASSAPPTSTVSSSPASSTVSKTSASVASTSTSTSTSAPIASPQSSSSISGGAIAGIVIGSLAIILVLGATIFFLRKHFQQKQKPDPHGPAAGSEHAMYDYKHNPHQSSGNTALPPSQKRYMVRSELD